MYSSCILDLTPTVSLAYRLPFSTTYPSSPVSTYLLAFHTRAIPRASHRHFGLSSASSAAFVNLGLWASYFYRAVLLSFLLLFTYFVYAAPIFLLYLLCLRFHSFQPFTVRIVEFIRIPLYCAVTPSSPSEIVSKVSLCCRPRPSTG
ncbi:hypothetical protein C8Q79DRAFT_940618 [Trametes meyenii]|nr:hypothetical protein C8Q79DRAFT_940618 [Trametes meyenii]